MLLLHPCLSSDPLLCVRFCFISRKKRIFWWRRKTDSNTRWSRESKASPSLPFKTGFAARLSWKTAQFFLPNFRRTRKQQFCLHAGEKSTRNSIASFFTARGLSKERRPATIKQQLDITGAAVFAGTPLDRCRKPEASESAQMNSKNISLRLRSGEFLRTRLFRNSRKKKIFGRRKHMFSFVDWWKQRESRGKSPELLGKKSDFSGARGRRRTSPREYFHSCWCN